MNIKFNHMSLKSYLFMTYNFIFSQNKWVLKSFIISQKMYF